MEDAVGDAPQTFLGPVWIAEPLFMRRMRVHQAWYRVVGLRELSYGSTPPPKARSLGSILAPAAAEAGLNFLSEAAGELYRERRGKGWGIDPVRTRAYLTSSQALTLNLFGPLIDDPGWFSRVFTRILGTDLEVVPGSIEVEYFSPRPSQALGDRTTIDVKFLADTPIGLRLVAVETKLADRFSTRRVDIGPEYASISDVWTDRAMPNTRELSQLARVHALAEFEMRRLTAIRSEAKVIVIRHDDDASAEATIASYSNRVTLRTTVMDVKLSAFVMAMRSTSDGARARAMVDRIAMRYVRLEMSKDTWSSLKRSRSA